MWVSPQFQPEAGSTIERRQGILGQAEGGEGDAQRNQAEHEWYGSATAGWLFFRAQNKSQIDDPYRLDFPVSPVREETMIIAGQVRNGGADRHTPVGASRIGCLPPERRRL